MTWNYRIVKYRDGSGYGLHEVYCDDDGKPYAMTATPADFVCDDDDEPDDITDALVMALKDSLRHSVFDEPDDWATQAPAS